MKSPKHRDRGWYERELEKQEAAGVFVDGKVNPRFIRWLGGQMGLIFGTFGTLGLMAHLQPVHPLVAVAPLIVGPSVGVLIMLRTGTALTGIGRVRFVTRTENPVAFWSYVGVIAVMPLLAAVYYIVSVPAS